jgi:hypothetical protein
VRDLQHKTQLAFTKHGVDRPYDPGRRADRHPVADFDWSLVGEVTGRNNLLAASRFVSVLERRHRP